MTDETVQVLQATLGLSCNNDPGLRLVRTNAQDIRIVRMVTMFASVAHSLTQLLQVPVNGRTHTVGVFSSIAQAQQARLQLWELLLPVDNVWTPEQIQQVCRQVRRDFEQEASDTGTDNVEPTLMTPKPTSRVEALEEDWSDNEEEGEEDSISVHDDVHQNNKDKEDTIGVLQNEASPPRFLDTPSSNSIGVVANPRDVVCTAQGEFVVTSSLEGFVQEFSQRYASATDDKKAIVDDFIDQVHQDGGLFLVEGESMTTVYPKPKRLVEALLGRMDPALVLEHVSIPDTPLLDKMIPEPTVKLRLQDVIVNGSASHPGTVVVLQGISKYNNHADHDDPVATVIHMVHQASGRFLLQGNDGSLVQAPMPFVQRWIQTLLDFPIVPRPNDVLRGRDAPTSHPGNEYLPSSHSVPPSTRR